MRRNLIHAMFGAVALCSAAVAAYDWTQLSHARDVAAGVCRDRRECPARATPASTPPRCGLRARSRWRSAGAYADAQKLYDGLVREQGTGEIGRAALFDLGNMYAREAGRARTPGS